MAFEARLTDAGMMGSQWWYSNGNIYYAADAGIGLPNCTCYAYGRAAEILGSFEPITGKLPMDDGGGWFYSTTGLRKEAAPNCVPELGGIMCFSGGTEGGHVAVIEQINKDGNGNIVSVVTSNSAYGRPDLYFYLMPLSPDNNYGWQGSSGYYTLQGIIYIGEGGGYAVSDYVLSAIAGVWNLESGLNPTLWETTPDFGSWTDYNVGYGLGQWTNTRGVDWDSPALINLKNWCSANGYNVQSSPPIIEPNGELAYFLYNTSQWAGNSPYMPQQFYGSTFEEFLSTNVTDLTTLVTAFFVGWESVGAFDPTDSTYRVDDRIRSAELALAYLPTIAGDDPSSCVWVGYNDADVNKSIWDSTVQTLTEKTKNNLKCMYFWFQGHSPTPPTPPTPTRRKGMPLWMMLRYY